jgi:hypothetical protein
VLHFGRGLPFGHHQCHAKGDVQSQGLLGMRRRLWQGREQFDPGRKVADGFHISRAVAGLLAGALPVEHRLLGAARCRVVLGHQLRLRLADLREAVHQHLGNPLVVLLPGTLE